MTRDFLIPLREAILTSLKANDELTALVPAERIYPARTPATPAWPFGRYGAPTDMPWRSSGEDGQHILTAMHFFARATDQEPDGEDFVGRIKAVAAKHLDGPAGRGLVLDLGGGVNAIVQQTGGRILRDGDEADDWHAIVNLDVVISA